MTELNADIIKFEAEKKDFTMAVLSRKLGMANRQQLDYILNYRKSCSLKTLCKLGGVLGLSLDELVICGGEK